MSRKLRFRRIRLRLTQAGILYILFTLTAGIVAVNSGNNILFLVVAALLSLLTLSGLLAYLNLQNLSFSALLADEIYAGRPSSVRLELTNHKRRIPSFLLQLGENDGDSPLTAIPPGEQGSLSVRMTFEERGLQTLGEQVLLSEFPFGLVRRGGTFIAENSVLVYPQPKALNWNYIESAERDGENLSQPWPGVGGDYRGLRDYIPGDGISRVQWKGWLRHRRLLTKEFESEGAAPVIFSYDSVPGPGMENRLSQLTWLVRTSFRRGRAVGLTLPNRTYPPGTGLIHRRRLLAALALFGGDNVGANP